MGQLIKVAETNEVPPGTAKAADVEGRAVALFNVDGTYYAIDDTCTPGGGSLWVGAVGGGVVTGPGPAAPFAVATGNVLGPPAAEGVAHYNVQVEGSDIKVGTP
jgi:nitrite reductase/ring-hydroxylating ferredoxin subunit